MGAVIINKCATPSCRASLGVCDVRKLYCDSCLAWLRHFDKRVIRDLEKLGEHTNSVRRKANQI